MPVILQEKDRKKLDSIVQQMVANKEPDENIRFVVGDFKSKYGAEKKSKVGGASPIVLGSDGLAPLNVGNMDDIKAFVLDKPVAEIKATKQANMRPPAKITTPVLTQVKSQKPTEKSIGEEANRKIEQIADEDFIDPIKGINKLSQANPTNAKDILATQKAKDILLSRMASDGFDAKDLLNRSFFGGAGDDNITSRELRNKAADYDKSVAPLRDIEVDADLSQANDLYLDYNYKDKVYSAAVQAYAEKHPSFKKELGVTGIDSKDWVNLRNQIPNGKMGVIMSEYLSDPNVSSFLQKENPSLLPAFEHVQKNLLKDNNDFAINEVANKVSKEVQKTGFNNIAPIFNYYGDNHKEYADQIARQVLSPEELAVWDKDIKNNQEQYMDAPSLMQGVAEGGEGVFKGIGNTFTEPFRSASESTKRRWEKESSNVSADPQGIFKVMRDTGHVLGLVGAIAGTGNVLGGGGAGIYSSNIVPALSGGVLPFMGDMLEEGRAKYPDSPVKAWTSALFNTSMYAALSQSLFPAKKLQQAIGSVKPEINNIVERLANGSITKEAARLEANTTFKKVLDFAGGTLKTPTKITAELTAIQKLNKGFDYIMMDEKDFEKFHPETDEAKDVLHLWLSNIALGGFSKFGEMKKRNRVAEESYYELASNPNKYGRLIDNLSVDKSFGTINEFKENLTHISNVKRELDGLKIHPKDQKRFIFESLKEKAAKEEAERTTDPTIQQKSKEAIKGAKEVKEKILAGEDAETVVTESEQKKIDEQRENEIKLERLTKDNELENKKLDAQRSGLDGRNPDDKLKIEVIEEKRKRANEDYESELSKLKPKQENELSPEQVIIDQADKGKLAGGYSELVKQDPSLAKDVLLDYAKQKYGLGDKGEDREGGGREIANKEVNAAVTKAFPDKESVIKLIGEKLPPSTSPSVVMPGEIQRPETITIAPKENVVDPKSKVSIILPKQEGSEKTETTVIPDQTKETVAEPTEPNKAGGATEGGGTEAPPTEGSVAVSGEGNIAGITHAANEVRRRDRGLPEYQKSPETFEAWNTEAERQVKEGYDVEGLMNRIEAGADPTPVENAIRKIYIATLDAEIARNPTDQLLAKQKRFAVIGDLANSRAGKNLVSLKGEGSPLATISDFYVAKMEAAGVDKLTEQQKKETKEAFDNVQKADADAEAKLKIFEEENAKLKAENELLKQAKEASKKKQSAGKGVKKTREDFVKERTSLKEELKAARKEHEDWLKEQGIQKSGFGSFTGKEAKVITKIVKSYVDEGVIKLQEVVDKVFEEVKDIFPGITDKDIHDVIAGEYAEKRPTRSELAAKMRDLKDEAYYVNKLDRILKGEEPKSEKARVERNRQITKLREIIKDVSGYEAEVKKAESEMLSAKSKAGKVTEKELGKAEKEIDVAEEKERKRIEAEEEKERKLKIAEAKKEAKQLEREFEKEKREEQKKAIKSKLDEARKLEKELSFRTPEEKALDAIINRNKKQEQEIRERIAKGDFETKKKVPFLEDTELQKKFPEEYKAALDAIVKKEEARHEFDIALLRDQMAKRNWKQIGSDWLSKSAGTAKAIVTGIDDSAVAIQTYMSLLRRPRTGATALWLHVSHAASQKRFNRWLAALHQSSDWKFMKDAGLDVTEPQSLKEREKEEIFNNRFSGTIKVKGKEYKLIDAPLKPFERAFTTLGNVTRVTGFRTIAAKYMNEGYTFEKDPELFKSLARRLNEQTGRGQQNEYVENAAKVITLGIWSPRLMSSKFNILGISDIASIVLSKAGTKGYYRQLHPKERLAAIRDIAQFATTVMALSYGFALAFGGDVDDDPLSSTFMDIRMPNGKSYNFTGGFSGYIRAIAQFAAGKKHKDGKTIKVNPLETAGRFFRGKTPPLTSAGLNMASGKNFMGQPTTALEEAENALLPISIKGIVQQIENDGSGSFFTQGVPTFFGFNVKNEADYKKPETSQRQSRPQRTRERQQR